MSAKQNLELKVGLFALIALIILVIAVFSISEVHIFRKGYFINVSFTLASGLDAGATVRVAGIQAGEVKEINMCYDNDKGENQIVLSVWLDEGVQVPRDSVAYVNILGLLGEMYLEIVPGEDYANLLKAGDRLKGRDPFSTETTTEVLHKVGSSFDELLGSLNDVLDEEAKVALRETVHNFRDFSQSVKVISGRLERGEGRLGKWLKPKEPKKKRSSKKTSEPEDAPVEQPGQNFSPR